MKCPKCEYLGFDTGTRCRNCGYDFSLMGAPAPAPAADLQLHEPDRQTPDSTTWLDQFALDNSGAASTPSAPDTPDAQLAVAAVGIAGAAPPSPAPMRERRVGGALPLFAPGLDDDEPLIKLPAAPRAPLSVRKTKETPKLRAVARAVLRPVDAEPEPSLDFPDEAAAPVVADEPTPQPAPAVATRIGSSAAAGEPGGVAPRLLAALLDHGLLLGLDAAVLYFTLRVAGLQPADWALLPPVPVLFFLGLLKVAYFAAFTAVGGQTIGKMAAGIAVVTEGGQRLDLARALKRSLAGAVSVLSAGLGFLPALIASDRRALHDRVAGTRVVVRTS